MPLMHGKSKKAFSHNVGVEMEHGHPLKQSLAIAYSVKRKAAKKHAKGGAVEPKETFMEHEAKESKAKEYAEHHAHGGMLTHSGYQPSEVPHYDADFADMDHDVEEMASGYVGHPGAHAKHDAAAEHEDMKKLNQHGKHEIGPKGHHYAKGGEIHPHQSEKHELDMVGKIMKMRQHAYAKGGKVHKDYSGGQKKGPEGYPKYQEQAQNEKGIHIPVSGVTQFPGGKSTSKAGDFAKDRYAGKALFNEEAKKEHRKVLHEMKHMPKPKLKGLAHGGAVHHYSHGGKVANNTHPFKYEFHTPNEFDDLVNRDNLEFHYTGENSGDYLSDAREDHDRKDMVSKIMKSRAKKDKLPPHYGK